MLCATPQISASAQHYYIHRVEEIKRMLFQQYQDDLHKLNLDSTLMRECTVIIYTLTEYEFLILGSKHPTVLFTDHKPIILFYTEIKSKR